MMWIKVYYELKHGGTCRNIVERDDTHGQNMCVC